MDQPLVALLLQLMDTTSQETQLPTTPYLLVELLALYKIPLMKRLSAEHYQELKKANT
jgi:hypothetical protein